MQYKTKTVSEKAINKKWILLDAEDKVLGRLASRIAYVIKGKNKTNFSPNIDCGDNVIVLNASKVRLTGNKLKNKIYISHTGYPGGQRETTPMQLLKKNPKKIIEHAVKGMLPKNRLGRALFNNLYVYEGNNHPHIAQKPEKIEFV